MVTLLKKLFLSTFLSCMFYLVPSWQLSAQERLHYWEDSETYLQDQASVIIENAYKVLAAYPPTTISGNERKLALFSLDALFHDTRLDNSTAFLKFMDRITSNIASELSKDKPSGNEMRFFRFYNHGFIIQTSSVTVGIDLVRGGRLDKPFISESLMRSIVDQCDILFLTHRHGDHTDFSVAKMFCEQGKKVIVPEIMYNELSSCLKVVRGTDFIHETIRLTKNNIELNVFVYPGKQGNILNNVYMITLPEGKTIVHTGDQEFSDDLISKISNNKKVDVLLVQCWMLPMEKFVSGIKPVLVILGHENEMLHSIDHRESYWLTFRRMTGVKEPYIVMAWGEKYDFGEKLF